MKTVLHLHCARLWPLWLVVATALRAAGPPLPPELGGATPLQWSVRMADSEIARRGDKLEWKEGERGKWDYTSGLFTLSLLKLQAQVHDPRYLKFAERAIGSSITPDGAIRGYKAEDYNLDNLNPGKTVLALYELTKEERYKKAATLLRKQLERQPRTREGGFWHKQRYPHQMWLDGIYMGAPFYAQYAALFAEPASSFDDVAKQIRLVAAHTYNPETGLYYHGWDESRQQDWANKTTGTSSNFWGRAIGWYGMALVDVLDFFPTNQPARGEIISILRTLCAGVARHQDPASGLWYQVMDRGGDEGNYLEATASSMFVYTLAKGVNRGYLPREYVAVALKGYGGLVSRLMRQDTNGQVSLTRCCSVAGLGYGRDGSYAYYLKEPVVDNDLKGVGPFILAGIELQALLNLPMSLPPIFEAKQFGARGDGKTVETAAIQQALDACGKAGGGVVRFSAGTYLSQPIRIRSNTSLLLEEGATLKATDDPGDYLPPGVTWDDILAGRSKGPFTSFLSGKQLTNVTIAGKGTIDGSGARWWVPAEEARRRVSGYTLPRPDLVRIAGCQRLTVTGITLQNSPKFHLVPEDCEDVVIEGVTILAPEGAANTDAIDPSVSRRVRISRCLIDVGDDNVAIKSGRKLPGRDFACEDLTITDCTFKHGHGVSIGSDTVGGVRNVTVRRCQFEGTENGIRIKSYRGRGGIVENVTCEDLTMKDVLGAITITAYYPKIPATDPAQPLTPQTPIYRNIRIANLKATSVKNAGVIIGLPESPVQNLVLENVQLSAAAAGLTIRNATGVQLLDVQVTAKEGPPFITQNAQVRGLPEARGKSE